MREPLWQSRTPVESSSTPLEWKKKSDIEHTGESKKNSLTLPMSPLPKVAQLSAKGALFSPNFLGNKAGAGGESSKWAPGLPSCAGCCQRVSFLSSPIQSLELHDWGAVHGWENNSQGSKHIKDADPTNCLTDSVERPVKEPEGCLAHGSPKWLTSTPSVLWASPICPLPEAGSLSALPMVGRASLGKCLVSMCRKPAGICVPGRDHNKHLATSSGKQNGSCQHPAWCVAGSREGIQ